MGIKGLNVVVTAGRGRWRMRAIVSLVTLLCMAIFTGTAGARYAVENNPQYS